MAQVKVYLPTDANKYGVVHDFARRYLIREYGGCTEYEATGSWQNPEDETIVTEPVTVMESYASDVDAKGLQHLALRLKRLTGEDSVAYAIDADMYFV